MCAWEASREEGEPEGRLASCPFPKYGPHYSRKYNPPLFTRSPFSSVNLHPTSTWKHKKFKPSWLR